MRSCWPPRTRSRAFSTSRPAPGARTFAPSAKQGSMIDLDEYDCPLRHLVVWNRERSEVVGAYRIGETDAILPRFGIRRPSTPARSSTTAWSSSPAVMPALELGRAFVRLEYQKSYSSLFLLWKASASSSPATPGTVSCSAR